MEHEPPRPTKSRFATGIETLYSMHRWYRLGGLAFLLGLLILDDDLRHMLMRMIFLR